MFLEGCKLPSSPDLEDEEESSKMELMEPQSHVQVRAIPILF